MADLWMLVAAYGNAPGSMILNFFIVHHEEGEAEKVLAFQSEFGKAVAGTVESRSANNHGREAALGPGAVDLSLVVEGREQE